MSTDAVNTGGELVYVYPEFTVLLGPTDGTPPGLGDTFEDVRVTRVVQSAGGSRLDFAEITYALESPLQDREQPDSFSRMVEVRIPDGSDTLIHRGDYVKEAITINADGKETLDAQSQVRAYHFGVPVRGYWCWNNDLFVDEDGWTLYPLRGTTGATIEKVTLIQSNIVFNPQIDDTTVFNRAEALNNLGHPVKDSVNMEMWAWVHPEQTDSHYSVRSDVHVHNATAGEWTLDEAVLAMASILNDGEEFIANPSRADLSALNDAPELRGVTIPIGTTLPQALDTLLIPHGFNWYVDYTTTPKPKIVVYEIGVGDPKELYLQSPGESLNLEYSNLNQCSVENGIGDSFNQVRVYGNYEECEFTFPLYPAWSEDDDSLTVDEVAKDGAEYVGKENVHRLWIANESGDLDPDELRFGMNPKIPDMNVWFNHFVAHRRVLGEPLSYMGTSSDTLKQRRPIFVEYSIDAGETWEAALDSWAIKICPDQIGIYFDGDEPPSEIVDAGEDARIRITGTVFGDSRIERLAERQSWAVNGRTIEVVIDRPDKFHMRLRAEGNDPLASVFSKNPYDVGYDFANDTAEAQAYAEALRDKNHYAEIDCEFRLPGIHLEYQIGDLITKIDGREINLDAAPANAPDVRYVQVVERRFEYGNGGPSTVLIVDRGTLAKA